MKKTVGAIKISVGPEDILAILTDQRELLQSTRDAIAGEEESSLAGAIEAVASGSVGSAAGRCCGPRAIRGGVMATFAYISEMLSGSATDQRELLQSTRDAIAGEEESSLAGQLKLLRVDLSDRQRDDAAVRERFEAGVMATFAHICGDVVQICNGSSDRGSEDSYC